MESERTKSPRVHTESFAGLPCRVVDALDGAAPSRIVILCHGFGASFDDLLDLAPYLLQKTPGLSESCRFYFPNAPGDLSSQGMPEGRAWWPINMAQLAAINQSRNFDELTTVQPPGLLEASEQLAKAVREIQTASDVDDTQTILGGFSQGAMACTDVVLRHGLNPALLVLFSGTLLCRDEWSHFAASHPGCPVFQSHGNQDMVLPYPPSVSLSELLQASGFEVEFHSFAGPHTVPVEVLDSFSKTLTTMSS